jgi:hypothetical protein
MIIREGVAGRNGPQRWVAEDANLQPFATPDALDPILAHSPSHPL